MITKISSKIIDNTDSFGNKGKFLNILNQNGFNVPDGLLIDKEEYSKVIEINNIKEDINNVLNKLNKYNIEESSKTLYNILSNIKLSDKIHNSITLLLDDHKNYAIRSSSTKEDLDNLSFAGQYSSYLNIKGINNIESALIDCYKSLFSETSLSYILNNKIEYEDIAMGIVIQEMVNSEYSGICFTLNPLTGKDTEMIIEIAEGLGENIVSGRVKPEQYIYNWKTKEAYIDENKSKLVYSRKNSILNLDKIKEYGEKFLEIQLLFGYPCDIEFAIEKNKLYILQARQITTIDYTGYDYMWSTADFKDGGVSATVCTPYMWSLYEYIWEFTLRKFMLDGKILSEKELENTKLGDMFYGRCYWNLSAVKLAMSKIVGYKEREFDNEYGIRPTYKGDGNVTKITAKSLIKIARMALAQNKIVNERNKNHENYKSDLLKRYNEYKEKYDKNTIDDIKHTWYNLTKKTYLRSEATYFWQIFINTVHQSLYKESLLKYVNESEYLTLLSSIDNISHLLPFYEIWDLSRDIRKNEDSFNYWINTDTTDIIKDINSKISKYYLWEALEIIENFGYHSDKELDVTYPCYYEDYTSVINSIKDTVKLGDNFSPVHDKEKGRLSYTNILTDLKNKISEKEYKKVENKISGMREMLWWREEYRDISTRFYYIIRIYTIELAKELVKEKVINNVDDIWYLKVENLWNFIDNKIDKDTLNSIIKSNKEYYNAFRNYISENEIGMNQTQNDIETGSNTIKGLGANSGIITGTARVIENFDEVHRLKENDILVTKFTDTGWTPKFAIISGIVTEYGGILCHAAIVSREYGIPAIVNCNSALARIKDGDTITINGSTGEVTIN